MTFVRCILILAIFATLCSCQSVPQQSVSQQDGMESESEGEYVAEISPGDPWEKLNRKSHVFNEFADKVLAKPVAKAYSKVTPGFFKKRVTNFFTNLSNINNMVNNLFQGKVKKSASDFGRLLVNSTIGLGGLFDPATPMGLAQNEEDWGQTFAKWGIGSGPYLVVPFLGPNTVRSSVGRVFDTLFNPLFWYQPESDAYGLSVVDLVNEREKFLKLEQVIFGDKYIFLRDAYTQRREYLINDGEVEDLFGDDF